MIDIDIEARLGEFELGTKFSAPAAITALFGPSGSGKTSLLRLIGGLETPLHGWIKVSGRTLFDASANISLPPRQRQVGYVLQEASLFPHFTVRRNLAYSRWAGRRSGAIKMDDVCKILGIGHLLERMPGRLSGGERQRVAIGRALLSDPSILLLDEPLSALDTQRKMEILPFLEQVRDRFNIPMIYVSHSVDEITRLADYLVVMDDGQISASGAIEEVLAGLDIRGSGDHLEAGSLVHGICSAYDEQTGLAQIAVESQQISLPVSMMTKGTAVRLRIRPNDVALALVKPRDTSIQNMLECEISSIERLGPSHVDVGLMLGSQKIRSRITWKAATDLSLAKGQKCIALLKALALEGQGAAKQ